MKPVRSVTADLNSMDTPPAARPAWLRYGIAVSAVIVGWLARTAMTPTIGPTALPFIFFFPAVAAVAWYAGFTPAILSIALGALAANYFFTEPLHILAIRTPFEVAAFLAFVMAALFINCAILAMHRARMRLALEIEQRQRADLELAESRDLLATTLASIGDGVIVTDAQGRVTFLNAEAERLTGWKNSDSLGQPLASVFPIINEDTRQPVENPVEKVLRLGKTVGLANHTLLIARDGTHTPIDDSAAPIRGSDGPPVGVVLVFRDVTEQRRADEARGRLAAIIESSGDAIASKNLDGIIQTWNAGAQRLFGYRPEEIIGKPVTVLIPPDRLGEEAEIIDRLHRGQPSERLETVRIAKDGRCLPVSLSVSPVKDRDGRIIGASTILHDISDVLAAREALARERELLATTLTSIGDGVIVTDGQGRVTFLNAEAERLTAWMSAEAQGRQLPDVFSIVNEHTRQPVENPVEKVLRLGKIVGLANHTILLARDGREIPIDDSAAPIRQTGGDLIGVVLVFRDFTQRRQAEQALRESEARFSGVINSAMDAIIAVNAAQHVVLFNPAAEQMFGCSAAEAIGSPLDRFIPSRFREAHRTHVERFGQAGTTNRRMGALGTVSGLRSNGEEFPIEASISHMAVGGERLFTVILRDLTDRMRFEQELARHRDQLEEMVHEKTAALRQSLEQLRRSERLASIGTLAAGIAHEINNPIHSILLLAQYALVEPASAEGREAFQKIQAEALRAGRIVKNILKFSRDEKTQKEPSDLNEIVMRSVELAETYVKSAGLQLQLDLHPVLPRINLNRIEIEQVIVNLIKNAAEATDERVQVAIRTAVEDGDVLLSIADNGPGIPTDIQPQIFDPFFSTKRGAGGTGLGLSLCHSIIADHQGTVSVHSQAGKGTTFTIRLPSHASA